jgi:hypothetical protein
MLAPKTSVIPLWVVITPLLTATIVMPAQAIPVTVVLVVLINYLTVMTTICVPQILAMKRQDASIYGT